MGIKLEVFINFAFKMSRNESKGLLLTLDRGNSALKADVWDGNITVETVVMPPSCIHRQLPALVARHDISGAIYCSVTDDGSRISQFFSETEIPFWNLDVNSPMCLRIDYATPGTLGVDRIAGCIGAMTLFPRRELLVIDLGTAITYDRVSARGHFIGGNIAPGVSLRLKSLNAFTARLPKVELEGAVPSWGYDTDTALRSGAIRGIAAEVSYYRSMLPKDALVVLTGGSAPRIIPYLDFDYILEPRLVPIGLKSCLVKFLKHYQPKIHYDEIS